MSHILSLQSAFTLDLADDLDPQCSPAKGEGTRDFAADRRPLAGRAFSFVRIQLPQEREEVTRETFTFRLDKEKLEKAERRDGHYLLRSNLVSEDPFVLWELYIQLTQPAFPTI